MSKTKKAALNKTADIFVTEESLLVTGLKYPNMLIYN